MVALITVRLPRGSDRSDRAFEAGLELLLDGLRLRLAWYEND